MLSGQTNLSVLDSTTRVQQCGLSVTASMLLEMYLCEGGCNCLVLLQLEELADEVLLCETERLQLTEDLLKYLQRQRLSISALSTEHVHSHIDYF